MHTALCAPSNVLSNDEDLKLILPKCPGESIELEEVVGYENVLVASKESRPELCESLAVHSFPSEKVSLSAVDDVLHRCADMNEAVILSTTDEYSHDCNVTLKAETVILSTTNEYSSDYNVTLENEIIVMNSTDEVSLFPDTAVENASSRSTTFKRSKLSEPDVSSGHSNSSILASVVRDSEHVTSEQPEITSHDFGLISNDHESNNKRLLTAIDYSMATSSDAVGFTSTTSKGHSVPYEKHMINYGTQKGDNLALSSSLTASGLPEGLERGICVLASADSVPDTFDASSALPDLVSNNFLAPSAVDNSSASHGYDRVIDGLIIDATHILGELPKAEGTFLYGHETVAEKVLLREENFSGFVVACA